MSNSKQARTILAENMWEKSPNIVTDPREIFAQKTMLNNTLEALKTALLAEMPEKKRHSDEARIYGKLMVWGYNHGTVTHSKRQYVAGVRHTQNVEGLWSIMKPGIKTVYRHVASKYLQAYANEYAFRYSYRKSPSMFWALLGRVAQNR